MLVFLVVFDNFELTNILYDDSLVITNYWLFSFFLMKLYKTKSLRVSFHVSLSIPAMCKTVFHVVST